MGDLRSFPDESVPEGLTCIHSRIHCCATQETRETHESEYTEAEKVDIDNFLSTLAEVASAVARREQQHSEHESSSLHQGQ